MPVFHNIIFSSMQFGASLNMSPCGPGPIRKPAPPPPPPPGPPRPCCRSKKGLGRSWDVLRRITENNAHCICNMRICSLHDLACERALQAARRGEQPGGAQMWEISPMRTPTCRWCCTSDRTVLRSNLCRSLLHPLHYAAHWANMSILCEWLHASVCLDAMKPM